ncbi:MAG: ABC transporter substrate-binding protein [Acidaminococcaceae bacterium]
MKKYLLIILCLLLIFTTGCGKPRTQQQNKVNEITITDMSGRKVTLKHPVHTYALSTIDLIDFVIPLKGKGAFDDLVGVGDSGGKKAYDKMYDSMFPGMKERVKIISAHNAPFDVEAILQQKPDVLIVNSAMQGHTHALAIEDKLNAAGIPLVLVNIPDGSGKSVQQTLALFGQIFGRQEKANEVIAFIDKQFSDLQSHLPNKNTDKPLVYYEMAGSLENYGPSSFGGSSGWGSLIQLAGGENLADKAIGGKKMGRSVVLDPEFIIENNPNYIILSGCNALGLGSTIGVTHQAVFSLLQRSGWDRLDAVRKHHVFEYQHEFQRSIMLFYPVLSMAKTFYPEQFKNIDPEERLAEFYKRFMLIKSTDGLWKIQAK